MHFCREYHANLSFLDGKICVIDYYTSRISMNDDHEFMTKWILVLPERLRQSKDSLDSNQ